jgi:phospholipase/carboxylesterase
MLHHFIRHAGVSRRPAIFLHGSGGDEQELMDFADAIAPKRPAIFLRGSLQWEDGFAFFRRLPNRSLDLADLEQRAVEIIDFILALKQARTLVQSPVLVGYSNGAIMAEALFRQNPKLIAGAVLMRPLSPDLSGESNDLTGKPVLITSGENDDRRTPADAQKSLARLETLGATAELKIYPTGHAIASEETNDISDWLARHFAN